MAVSGGLFVRLILLVFASHAVTAGRNVMFEMGTTYVYSASGRIQLPEFLVAPISFSYEVEVSITGPRQLTMKTTKLSVRAFPAIVPDSIRTQMESSVIVNLREDGTIDNVQSDTTLPEWALNIKQDQIYRLVVTFGLFDDGGDTTGRRGGLINFNEIRPTTQPSTYNGDWDKMEKSLLGECQTSYSVRKILKPLEMLESSSSASSESNENGATTEYGNMLRRFCSQPGTNFYRLRRTTTSQDCTGAGEADILNSTLATFDTEYTFCGRDLTRREDLTMLKVHGIGKADTVGNYDEDFTLIKATRGLPPTPLRARNMLRQINMATHEPIFTFATSAARNRLGFAFGWISHARQAIHNSVDSFLKHLGFRKDDNSSGNTRLDSRIPAFRTCVERKGLESSRLIDPVTNASGYAALNFQWNIKFKKVYPIAFLLPTTSRHVQIAVQCGVIAKIRLVPNSGGHSYDSISWGDNTTLVIDFQEMNKVELTGAGKPGAIAVLQPGALLGPTVAQLWKLGKVGLPVGNCLTVGVGGHALGGGIGLFGMVHGLLIDNLVEYEMVDAAGDIVVASETENPDLFWSLRGIGPGFIGIITRYRIRTFQADRMKFTLVKLNYPVKDFVPVASATQDFIAWTKVNDPMIGTMAMAYSDDWNATNSVTPGGSEPGIVISFIHIFDPDRNPSSNATFLAKIAEMFPVAKKKAVFFPNYLELHFATSYSPVILPTPPKLSEVPISPRASPFPPEPAMLALFMKMTKSIAIPRYFKAKSHYVNRKLTTTELQRLDRLMPSIPANRAGLMVTTEIGAIHTIPTNAMAYSHRAQTVNFRVHIEARPEDGDIGEAERWMDQFWPAMKSFDSGETYQNYPDLDVKDYLKRYYTTNLEKIVSSKKKWDPTNYFKNAQSLPTCLPETDEESVDPKQFAKFRSCMKLSNVPSKQLVDPVSNSSGYETLNLQWNTRIEKVYPVAYLVPLTNEHVAAAVRCGVQQKIHLIPSSGGHSYEAISYGTNDTIVIDFREMTNVALSQERVGNDRIAVIQPGALVGPINAQLWTLGGVAIPMGNCLTVGIGGHAVGGGIGFFSAMYGLTIDRVVEYELVDATGQIIIASEKVNPDVFWALRGSAAGYIGIVTQVKVRTFKADKIQITAVKIVYPIKDFPKAGAAMQNWIEWTKQNDPTIFTTASITNDDWSSNYPATAQGPIGGVILSTLHIYDPDLNPHSNETFLAKINEIFPPGHRIKDVSVLPYIAFVFGSGYAPIRMTVTVEKPNPSLSPLRRLNKIVVNKIVEIGRLDDPILDETVQFKWHNPIPPPTPIGFTPSPLNGILAKLLSMRKELAMPRHFHAKSHFVKRKLTMEEIARLGQVLLRIPNNRCWILVSSEGGAVKKFDSTEMAYVHRDALIDVSVHVEATETEGDVSEAEEWLREFWDAMQSFDGAETYQNYPDLELADFLKRYYGKNLPRLVEIKRKLDPKNYFRNQISLPTTLLN